jgi:ATP-dependent protease ClpP protease subunit
MKKIIISGEIGWDITADDVRKELNSAKGADLDVHIASPGGYVSSGLEIFNLFRDYKKENPDAQTLATIKGIAASMATYLANNPAFDLVAAEDNAVFMIHNAWGGAIGDYRDMLKISQVLDGLTGIIAKAYVQKTGKSNKTIRQMMDEETWLFGDEIKEAGFVDEIIKTDNDDDKVESLALAKTKFSELSAKLKEKPENFDYNKIAAMINLETDGTNETPRIGSNTEGKKYSGRIGENSSIHNYLKKAQNPVQNAGKNKMEVSNMTLKELLGQNPTAKIEYENELNKKFEAGKKEGKESMQATINIAAKYLGKDENENSYPAAIQNIACSVLKGEKSAESLETTVAAFDALKEATNSANAQTEQPPETNGQQTGQLSTDGNVKSLDDYNALIAKEKAKNGVEVR